MPKCHCHIILGKNCVIQLIKPCLEHERLANQQLQLPNMVINVSESAREEWNSCRSIFLPVGTPAVLTSTYVEFDPRLPLSTVRSSIILPPPCWRCITFFLHDFIGGHPTTWFSASSSSFLSLEFEVWWRKIRVFLLHKNGIQGNY